jgi:very-short-patch-repair endonuclease
VQRKPPHARQTQQVAALARRQRGFVTRKQLLALGLGPDAVEHRVGTGQLIREYRGVYAVGHVPVDFADRAAAAVLACGPRAVLSHGSAASLWGLRKRWERPFEVTVPTYRRPRGITVHRSTALAPADTRTHLGVRVTSPARTLLDYAPRLTDGQLTRAVNDLRLSGYLNLSDLAELLTRTHKGSARLKPFADSAQNPTRSRLEDEFLRFARRHGLPTPRTHATVAGYEVDALFAEHRLIVELDGYAYHSDRASFERDRERDANTLAAGYRTVRLTSERLRAQPETEAERLHELLRSSQVRVPA